MTLVNAPLIEIIAELRWAGGRGGQPMSFAFGGDESQYVKLGIALGKHGYDHLERLHPEGVPSPAGSVLYRFRRGDEAQNTLYQVGPGVFTANGLPPYNSWSEFVSVLEQGVEAVWAGNIFKKDEPIELILKYVDAFTDQHLAGLSRQEFIRSFMGVEFSPTDAAKKFSSLAYPSAIRLSAVHEAPSGEKAVVEFGEGYKDGELALIVNTSAVSAQFVPSDVEQIMQSFGTLQAVLHDMFFEMLNRTPGLNILGPAGG